jgi:hypothetical protein
MFASALLGIPSVHLVHVEKSLFFKNFDRIKLNAEEDHFESQDQEANQNGGGAP